MEYIFTAITALAVFLITRRHYMRKIVVLKGQALSEGERSQLKQVLEIMTWDGAKHED